VAEPVTVAVPVLNGGVLFGRVLAAVRSQRLNRPLELLVVDSGSTDESRDLALRNDAKLLEIPAEQFSHGGTRNLLMERASGSHVAFLSQDAVPADDQWLARLLKGFDAAEDVGLVFGPYRGRADCTLMVRRELDDWFASFSRRVERGVGVEPDVRRTFFSDANGCVARGAWEKVPFRAVAYAEDQLLARDMLAAGFAKVYQPDAAVIHSHDYPTSEQFQRSFDEWRGLREVGAIPAAPGFGPALLGVQRATRDDLALARREGHPRTGRVKIAAASLRHHAARAAGAALGARADRLPPNFRRALSLENRAEFQAIEPRG
jgi:glycosyltransferase involved in cell wall biosynthesis